MSDIPRASQGQIETPNPLELFWEKHHRVVWLLVGAVAAALAANYGARYYADERRDSLWTGVAEATNLDAGYTEPGSFQFILEQQSWDRREEWYLSATRNELVSKLPEQLKGASAEQLDRELAAAAGTEAEPIVLWVAARRAVEVEDWDRATSLLDRLERDFPKHFLCARSDYPVQYRPEVEDPEAKKPKESQSPKKPNQKPALEAARAGSAVSMLRAQIEEQQSFAKTNAWLYEAPEPDAKPTVVVKLSNDEEFKIRFYRDKAPKHVESFLARVREGFYKDMRIDEVHRVGKTSNTSRAPEELHLGLPAARDADRTKWIKTGPSGSVIEDEFNDISHFPGMVAAAPEPSGGDKSSGERVWINANECSWRYDGERVVFGRVVDGLDVVQHICTVPVFTEEQMGASGQGQLQDDIWVTSMIILDDPGPTGGSGQGASSNGENGGAGGQGEGNGGAEKPKPQGEGNGGAEESKPQGEGNGGTEEPKPQGEGNGGAEEPKPQGEGGEPKGSGGGH